MVDEHIISSKSLNGQVLNKYVDDIDNLNSRINDDIDCKNNIVGENDDKKFGKTTRYKLGTCFKYSGYIFVAFSKIDSQYKAYLDMPSYMFCLTNFWNELNRVYNGESIVVPLLGSGITRIENCNISKQEQLEILINSLQYSNLSFSHDVNITIVLPESLKNEIKLFNLKEED